MERLTELMRVQFEKMCKTGKLFRSSVDPEQLWTTYLEGMKPDPTFRDIDSSVHRCNYCHAFVRRYGSIIALDSDLNIMTLFDLDIQDKEVEDEYGKSVRAMSALIKGADVGGVFIESLSYLVNPRTPYESNPTDNQPTYLLGVRRNTKRYLLEDVQRWPDSGIVENQTITFNHFYVEIPAEFINKTGDSTESLVGLAKSNHDVLVRAMEEVSLDTLELIKDLTLQGSLLNGDSYMRALNFAIDCKKEYNQVEQGKRDRWAWSVSSRAGGKSKFLNTAIGTLMSDLSQGMEINEACKSFNYKVDPANYMKASAPITKKQIEEAEKFVKENGYEDSFNRRCAVIDDIDLPNILHINSDSAKAKSVVSVFDGLTPTHSQHKKAVFDNVEEVGIEKFMQDILPGCTGVELYLENRHAENFVSLITSTNKDSKRIFKWQNNFSWTYTGNLAGKSMIKKAVKSAGGFVGAPFRFSILWNEDGRSIVDFDAHLVEPGSDHIYYGSHNINKMMDAIPRQKSSCGGVIDIDMIRPRGVGVENIFYPDMSTVRDGLYHLYIHNFDGGKNSGVKAEVVVDNQTFNFEVGQEVKKDVQIADIYIKNGQLEKIEKTPYLVSSETKQVTVFGLDTLEFHKVNLLCLSPNYWQENGVGNKHYFFMLEGAVSPEDIRTFHNEFLTPELLQHRKVMEVLGHKCRCKSVPGQLSGLGFNATVRDEVVVRLSGSHKRVVRIKF